MAMLSVTARWTSPALNRPCHDAFAEDDEANAEAMAALQLMLEWQALGDGIPGADLLQRSRQRATLPGFLDTLAAAAMARASGEKTMAAAVERMLLVLLETIQRRENSGSRTLVIDDIAQIIDQKIAASIFSAHFAAIFADVRRRLPKAPAPGSDPALERLMQVIQALRAKTVERGCTEQEAMAAAEKVAELLDRHGLSLGELDFRAQSCEGIGIQTNRRRRAPIDDCVTRIASYFDCRVWLEHARGEAMRYVFFGLRGDVAAAQ